MVACTIKIWSIKKLRNFVEAVRISIVFLRKKKQNEDLWKKKMVYRAGEWMCQSCYNKAHWHCEFCGKGAIMYKYLCPYCHTEVHKEDWEEYYKCPNCKRKTLYPNEIRIENKEDN